MGNKGFLKRMLPFLATFAVGIFIASFFVGFGGGRFRGRGWERRHECERMRFEYERLREENERMRTELQRQGIETSDWDQRDVTKPVTLDADVPPPPPLKTHLPKHDR